MTQDSSSIRSCGRLLLMSLLIMQFSKIADSSPVVDQIEPDSENVSYTYTIWVGSKVTESYTLSLVSPKDKNFYQAMVQAAEIDSKFAFKCKDTSYGHYVTTLAGMEEDNKKSIYWLLYRLPELPDKNNKPGEEQMSPVGVDELVVENGENYLFWYRKIEIHA